MKCKFCGAEIANDSTFCEHCGKQVGKDKTKRKIFLMGIGGIIVLIIVFFAGYILHSPKSGQKMDEVLNTVDEALLQSNKNVTIALEDRYNNLYAILGEEQTEAIKKAQEKAKKLQDLTKDMVKYIETIRWEMTIDVDGENASGVQEAQKAAKNGEVPCVPVSQIEGKENFDKPTAFMIGSSDKPDPDKYAVKLKKKLTDYHASLLKFIENEEGKRHPQIEEMLSRLKPADMVYSAHKKKEVPWEIYNFSHLNTGSQVILLNKMISEVKYAEGVVLNYIIASAGAANLAFAEYAGYSMADSRVLFPGDSYKTTVVVAAFDPMQKLDVYYQIGVDYLSEDNEGSANHVDGPATGVNIELPAGGTGQHKIAGYIKVRNENTGKVECYHFKDEYVVIPKQVMY